jgi:hypothetical protein
MEVTPGVSGPHMPVGNLFAFTALIDTGAQSTCISPRVATTIGLLPLGKTQIFGVSGVSYHNYYLFQIGFPLAAVAAGAQQLQASVAIFGTPIQGAELALPGQGRFDVLLGMDVIGEGSLAVEGSGTFSFSF